MKLIRDLLSQHSDVSMMRLMCFMAMSAAIALAFMGKDNSILVFVGAAMGGKVAQKHIEVNGVTETKEEK